MLELTALAQQAAAALFLQSIHPAPHTGPHPLSHAAPHLTPTNKLALRRYSPLCLHLQLNEHQKRKKEKRERRQERRAEKKKLVEQELEHALRGHGERSADESAIAREMERIEQTQAAQRIQTPTTGTRPAQQSLRATLASPAYTASLMMQLEKLSGAQRIASQDEAATAVAMHTRDAQPMSSSLPPRPTDDAVDARVANRQKIQWIVEAGLDRMRHEHETAQYTASPTTSGPATPLLHPTAHSPAARTVTSAPASQASIPAFRLSSAVTPAPPSLTPNHQSPHSPPTFRPVTAPVDLPTASPSTHQRRFLSHDIESTSPSLTSRFLLASRPSHSHTKAADFCYTPQIHGEDCIDEMDCAIEDIPTHQAHMDDEEEEVDQDEDEQPMSLAQAMTSPPDSNITSPAVISENTSPSSSSSLSKQSLFASFSSHLLKHDRQHAPQAWSQHDMYLDTTAQGVAFHHAHASCVV